MLEFIYESVGVDVHIVTTTGEEDKLESTSNP